MQRGYQKSSRGEIEQMDRITHPTSVALVATASFIAALAARDAG
jgi:hypothetical protein